MPLFALLLWPFVSLALFATLGTVKGLVCSALLGALFLPEAFSLDLPGLPALTKESIIVVGLVLGLLVAHTPPPHTARPTPSVTDRLSLNIIRALAALLVITAVFTVLSNRESLQFGPKFLPGLGTRDLISMTVDAAIFIVPYFIALRYLADPRSHMVLLKTIVLFGAFYAVLVLFEARMSPQLHRWTYGYFQHSWIQHIRDGNFRPIVFLEHGLVVGMFLATCTMAAFVLLKSYMPKDTGRAVWLVAGFGFFVVLFISRNFGALALTIAFVPLLWFTRPRMQMICAAVIVSSFLALPLLRQSGLVTFESTISAFSRVSESRANSLAFRVEQDDAFLERAALKPIAGWGGWSRARIHDPTTGWDISVVDGAWIIFLGERGWMGYIAFFGLLGSPMLLLLRRQKTSLPPQTSGIAVILAATLIYQIPNDTLSVMTVLLSGALAGFVVRSAQTSEDSVASEADPPATSTATPTAGRPGLTHTRFSKNAPKAAARPAHQYARTAKLEREQPTRAKHPLSRKAPS